MYENVKFIPVDIQQRAAILACLDTVLDPELDESVLKLGFIEEIALQDGQAVVDLHLPTGWCASNFAYMMAEDVRHALLTVEGIHSVALKLNGHFDSKQIEAGIQQGHSFMQAYPDEATEGLEPLRQIFLRKAYTARQLRFMRTLLAAGLTAETLCSARLEDIRFTDGEAQVYHSGAWIALADGAPGQRYLDQRAKLGLDCSPTSPLLIDVKGEAISPAKFQEYWRYARTIQVSMEANGSMCSALLQARDETRRQIALQPQSYSSTKQTFNLDFQQEKTDVYTQWA